MTPRQPQCFHAGCLRPVVWYTNPPLCRRHMGSLDEWFAGVKRASDAHGIGLAHHMYLYESVRHGPARIFHNIYERRERRKLGGHVAFHFADIVFFCAAAAASGVIGNLTYDALKKLIARIRNPKRELIPGGAFEHIVQRRTYNEVRTEHNGRQRARRVTKQVEEAISLKYELMVTTKPRPKKRKKPRKK